jgi:hypothetical protein
VPIERGTGGGNVQRIDRSNLRFSNAPGGVEAEAA